MGTGSKEHCFAGALFSTATTSSEVTGLNCISGSDTERRYVKPFSSDTGTSRTDGRTDRQTAISITSVSVLTRDKNYVQHPSPFQGQHLRRYLAYSELLKLMAASNARGVWKTRDYRRASGPSVLQRSNVPSTLRKYASDCVDRRRVTHSCCSIAHRWRCPLSHMLLQKYSKMQHIFDYNKLPWEATAPWLTF